MAKSKLKCRVLRKPIRFVEKSEAAAKAKSESYFDQFGGRITRWTDGRLFYAICSPAQ